MTNFEKVKEMIVVEDVGRFNPLCEAVWKLRREENCDKFTCKECYNWLKEEYKPQILTDKEREYLSNVIKPYRDRIVNIKKTEHDETKYEYIVMQLIFRNCFDDYLEFPLFNKDEYYKNMEIDRQYTLEELGL